MAEHAGYLHAEGARLQFAAIATGGMQEEEVQGVASDDAACHVEDVACGAHVLDQRDGEHIVTNRGEAGWLIEQRHVEPALVGRVGHQVLVAGIAQKRATGEVAQARVVLYLAQGHQLGQFHIVATRYYLLRQIIEFAPITPRGPVASRHGKELCVLLAFIMACVEEVLAVQFDQHERLRPCGAEYKTQDEE